jgi:membrane protein implicated in regulation of membrane protease activity
MTADSLMPLSVGLAMVVGVVALAYPMPTWLRGLSVAAALVVAVSAALYTLTAREFEY